MKRILLVGSGGREHALGWKMKQSEKLEELFFVPGNAGTATLGANIELEVSDFEGIKQVVIDNNINLVIVGPEVPLCDGIHDFFLADEQLKNVPVVGPKKDGAILEGSKDFAKEFMSRHNIPTAAYQTFGKENLSDAHAFLETLQSPYVLKADGLAAGKGVLIIDNLAEAKESIGEMLDGQFGDASSKVVIEEFLSGIELSVFALTDGKNYKLLPSAKDYKRIGEGDTGLNTGGMGAVSPVPFADDAYMTKIENEIVRPTIEGFQKDGIDFKGFVFFGLINCDGQPKVIEYNVRMGDPETEAVMLRLKSDLVDLFEGVAEGNLDEKVVEIDNRTACTVMMVAGGYPGSYNKGDIMTGFEKIENSILFHAGTKQHGDNVVTNGGRVLAISSYGSDIKDALKTSYKNAEKINFEGKNYRKDLGFDL